MNEKETNRTSMLDIIVPHYKEPWEVGEKFFAMLNLQRGIDFSSFRVTVVNDGEENALPDEHFQNRPYHVRQISIPHAGVSAARNAGLKEAEAEWVMFCDFDDMFSNVFSIKSLLNVLPANGYNILWSNYQAEVRMKNGDFKIYEHEIKKENIHAKLYRRDFLKQNSIVFDEQLRYCEDFAFNMIAFYCAGQQMIAKVQTETPIYLWCDTVGSVTNHLIEKEKAESVLYFSHKRLCELFYGRNMIPEYQDMIIRTILHSYYAFHETEVLKELLDDFKDFYLRNKTVFTKYKKDSIEKAMQSINNKINCSNYINEVDRFFEKKQSQYGDYQSLIKWLDSIEKAG